MNLFGHFDGVVRAVLSDMVKAGELPDGLDLSRLVVEPPRDASHGDVTTNAAMVLAKPAGARPRDLALALAKRLAADPDIEFAEVAGPGFVNLTLKAGFWLKLLKSVLALGPDYGHSQRGGGLKVNVEYVSANPTGPLHVGH